MNWRIFALLGASASTCSAQTLIVQTLPRAHEKAPYRWFASTDPKNQNDDYFLLAPGETRRVKLSAGRLERLWMTGGEPDKLRVVLQNGTQNVVLLENNRAVVGTLQSKAFTYYGPFLVQPGYPIEKLSPDATLVATNKSDKPNKWYFQASVRPTNGTVAIQPKPGKIKTVRVRQLLKDAESLGAVDVSGGFRFGQIEELKITLETSVGKPTVKNWNRVFLRGFPTSAPERGPGSLSSKQAPTSQNPNFAIDTPLNALMGQFFDARQKSDAVSQFDGQALTLRWLMPFDSDRDAPIFDLLNAASERVTVTLEARVRELSASPPTIFHAHYGSAKTQPKMPVPIASIKGSGAFVGLALAIKPDTDSARRAFAYLEGNETIRADGNTYEGTGTEDYFNSAWYFPNAPFTQPFGGLTWKQPLPPQVSMYRWQVGDAIPFGNGLQFDFEHGNGSKSDDLEWRWLAVWYQKPGGNWTVRDELRDIAGGQVLDSAQTRELDRKRQETFRRYMFASTGGLLFIGLLTGLIWLVRAKRTDRS